MRRGIRCVPKPMLQRQRQRQRQQQWTWELQQLLVTWHIYDFQIVSVFVKWLYLWSNVLRNKNLEIWSNISCFWVILKLCKILGHADRNQVCFKANEVQHFVPNTWLSPTSKASKKSAHITKTLANTLMSIKLNQVNEMKHPRKQIIANYLQFVFSLYLHATNFRLFPNSTH